MHRTQNDADSLPWDRTLDDTASDSPVTTVEVDSSTALDSGQEGYNRDENQRSLNFLGVSAMLKVLSVFDLWLNPIFEL